MAEVFEYSCNAATRRFIQPTSLLPQSHSDYTQTSYQTAYFPQKDEPRATDPRYATKPVRGVRPKSTIEGILGQSGTTAADYSSVSHSSYKPASEMVGKPLRFSKKQDPKEVPSVFPVTLERTRVRGK